MTFDADRLVDTERGLLDRRIFIEPEIYEAGAAADFRALLAVPVP